jgi:hypothetical protein
LRSYSFFDALTHTRSELKSAKLIRVIVHLHAPDPNPSNGFQKKKKKADYIMCALGKSSSVRQLDNNPSGAHLFFFFLAHNQPLVCFWPTVPIDNRPIGLIFFFFLLLLGSQLALVSSRTIVPIDNSTSGSSFFFCSWPTIGPFSILGSSQQSTVISLHHRLSLVACQPLVSSGSIRQSSLPTFVFYFQTQVSRIFHLKFKEGC